MATVDTKTNLRRKRDLGQFFTPPSVAEFMAGLVESVPETVRLLDPGAGMGALTLATVLRICATPNPPRRIEVSAFEIDDNVLPDLRQTMDVCHDLCAKAGIRFIGNICHEDFIAWGASAARGDLFSVGAPAFTTVVMNPPYRKIRSDSAARWQLRSAGLETSNLYSGFLALAASLLCDDGELVAITPRSFCNGPYFRPFREQFLSNLQLRRIHVFESRTAAFRYDGVLQENVILHGKKSASSPDCVTVSSSEGTSFSPLVERRCRYDEIVLPGDSERFIHIVADGQQLQVRQRMSMLTGTLEGLGLSVSTGRVVDFRAKEYLLAEPSQGAAPLIYPCHFDGGYVVWPRPSSRKPNAIVESASTRDLLLPNATYVLVRRFSSKEERKRVVACIHDAQRVPGHMVGFENHLNYFHANGQGLQEHIAAGLALYLNSTWVDSYFRQFNGHTQVNATDLRKLPYPSRKQILELGTCWSGAMPNQHEIDRMIERVLLHGPG